MQKQVLVELPVQYELVPANNVYQPPATNGFTNYYSTSNAGSSLNYQSPNIGQLQNYGYQYAAPQIPFPRPPVVVTTPAPVPELAVAAVPAQISPDALKSLIG